MLETNTNNSKGPNEKILSIQKGRELTIAVSDDMRSPTSFMHTAYRQAVCAVVGITEQTRRFHASSKNCPESELFDSLFRYSGNIIAFSGQRGGGKTSTMLSFAKLLKDRRFLPAQPCSAWSETQADPRPRERTEGEISPTLLSLAKWLNGEGPMPPSPCVPWPEPQADSFLQEQVKKLADMTFIPLSPIAPSILGEKQSILTVVLSRLYGYVAEQFENPNSNIPSMQKQRVSQAFQSCLAGLRGAKRTTDAEQEDFAMLQDVSDGMSLRTSFYRLTQAILEALQDGRCGAANTYLVLQLDDADSQLRVGYDVLEDIRKYLMLPNVIILTSADFDMLRRVVEQHYRLELSELMRDQNRDELRHDLTKAASKYIDKLIPPSNLICLPKLKSVLMRWGLQLKLRYGARCDLQEGKVQARSLQTDLLERIYRKTGIVFVPSSSSQPHDIVPTTLRGITQLLHLLEEMKDLPAYLPDEKVLSRQLPAAEFLDRLAGYIETDYLPVAEANLQKFSDYFVQEWVNARIFDPSHREFLARMERNAGAKVQEAWEYLCEKYQHSSLGISNSISDLDRLIEDLQTKHCKQGDLSLLFAVRTLITLENHMWVLQQKRAAVYAFREKGQTIAFQPHYYDEAAYLPWTYAVECGEWDIDKILSANDIPVVARPLPEDSGRQVELRDRYQLLWDCLVLGAHWHLLQLNIFNIVTFYLHLTEIPSFFVFTSQDKEDVDRYMAIYSAQEAALLIAANWDMWDIIRKSWPQIETDTQSSPGEFLLNRIFEAMDKVFAKCGIWDSSRGINQSWNNLCKSKIIDHSMAWSLIQSKGMILAGESPVQEQSSDPEAQKAVAIQITGLTNEESLESSAPEEQKAPESKAPAEEQKAPESKAPAEEQKGPESQAPAEEPKSPGKQE